jgi:hypothetical protein
MPAQKEAKKNSEYCPLGTAFGVAGGGGRNLDSYVESNYLESEMTGVSSGKNVIGVGSKGLADACGGR